MKKRIGAIIIAAALLTSGAAYADGAKLSDMINGTVTVSGTANTAGEKINILIIRNGVKLEDAEKDSAKVVYQSFVEADAEKKYSRNIKLDGGEDGYAEYLVYTGTKAEPDMIVIASFDSKKQKAKDLCSGVYQTVYDVLANEKDRKVLGINEAYVTSADLESVANKLTERLKSESFDFDNEDKTLAAEDIEELTAIVKEICLVDCYNNNSTELFSENEFLYSDILGLEKLAIYDGYKNVLNDTGKKNVQDGLTGGGFSDMDTLRKYFARLTMFNAIHNDVNSGGYGHITDLFTDENIDYAGLKLPNYKNLASKSDVNSKLITDNTLTLDNFESKIEEYAKSNGGGGGTSSGGVSTAPGAGSGASSSGITVAPITPPAEEPTSVFSDLGGFEWAEEAILFLNERGILSGVGANTFAPQNKLTREQAVKIICSMKGYAEATAPADFDDVDQNAWYAPYIAQAIENGIANGVSEREFGVGKSITRQDFVTMLYRSLNTGEEYEGVLGFDDASDIAEYARSAVGYFVDLGAVSGYPDNTFAPGGSITRAEAAKIVRGSIEE